MISVLTRTKSPTETGWSEVLVHSVLGSRKRMSSEVYLCCIRSAYNWASQYELFKQESAGFVQKDGRHLLASLKKIQVGVGAFIF